MGYSVQMSRKEKQLPQMGSDAAKSGASYSVKILRVEKSGRELVN